MTQLPEREHDGSPGPLPPLPAEAYAPGATPLTAAAVRDQAGSWSKPTSEAESEVNRRRINWDLLQDLATKPHPNQNHLRAHCCPTEPPGVGEVLQEALAAQHLLDLAGIPLGRYDDRNIDARMYLALLTITGLHERLDRIAGWHARETAEGGMVGDYCAECGELWPCDTRRMADGTHEDLITANPTD